MIIRSMSIRSIIILMALLLSACTTRPLSWNIDDYTVQSGDTLYSIAWRFELNPDDLARWNHLSNSALIYPGQRLHTKNLSASNSTDSQNARQYSTKSVPVAPKNVIVQKNDTLFSIANKHRLSIKQLAKYNNLKKPYVIRPGQKLKLSSSRTYVASKSTQNRSSQRLASAIPAVSRPIDWKWPIKGKLIKGFNKRLNDAKGIDIAGREGKGIKAAASGKVVYSGNGLIGYGNLVIIKHNQLYLSAYAHNRKLLVKEGQQVKVGQVIAELGKTGVDKPRLHFEIRKMVNQLILSNIFPVVDRKLLNHNIMWLRHYS